MGKYFNNQWSNGRVSPNKYFNSMYGDGMRVSDFQDGLSLENKVNSTQNRLEHQGVDVPAMSDRSLLDRILDAISITTYPIMGAIKSGIKDINKNGYSLNTALEGVKGAWEGVKAANPLGEGNPQGEATFGEVLNEAGYKSNPDKPWYSAENLLHGAAGITGDVLLDPSTYFSLGTGAVLKGTGKTLGKNSMKELGKEGFENAFAKFGRDGAKQALNKAGQEATDEAADSLLKAIRRRSGYIDKTGDGMAFGIGKNKTTFVQDSTLRALGDKTIAPYVNTLLDKIGASKVGQGFGDVFAKNRKLDKGLARTEPEEFIKEYANITALKDWSKDAEKGFAKVQDSFKRHTVEMFDGISDDTQKFMTNLFENEGMFKSVTEKIKTGNFTINKTPEAQEFYNKLFKTRQEVMGKLRTFQESKVTAERITRQEDLLQTIDKVLEAGDVSYLDIVNNPALKRLDFLKSLPKKEINNFFNEFINDDVSTIAEKLEKQGFKEFFETAGEVRAILDKSQEGFTSFERPYFKGQRQEKRVVGMDAGRPYISPEREEMLGKQTEQNIIDAGEKNPTYQEFLAFEKLKKEATDRNPFVSKKSLDESMKEPMQEYELKQMNRQQAQVRVGNIKLHGEQKYQEYVSKLNHRERRMEQINNILDVAMEDYKKLDAVQQADKRQKFFNKLVSMNDGELEGKFFDAQRYKGMNDMVGGKRKEIIDDMARYLVGNAKPTTKQEARKAFLDQRAALEKMSDNDLYRMKSKLEYEKQTLNAKKYFNGKDFDADSGSYRNMADRIETERFNKNAKEYAGGADYNDWADETLDPYTNANKKIDWKGEQGTYLKDKEKLRGDIMKNLGDDVQQNVFNVNGVEIFEKVGSPQNVKSGMVIGGLERIAQKFPKLSNYMGQLKVRLGDIDSWAEALTGKKNIIMSNGKASDALGKHIAKEVIPHEVAHNFGKEIKELLFKGGVDQEWMKANKELLDELPEDEAKKLIKEHTKFEENDWQKAMDTDGKSLFSNVKFANGNIVHEDFAESFVKYLNSPAQFQKEFPNRFDAMQKAMNDFVVPKTKEIIDRNVEAKYFVRPKTAKESVGNVLNLNLREKEKLVREIAEGGLSEDEVIKQYDELNNVLDYDEAFKGEYQKEFDGKNPYELVDDTMDQTAIKATERLKEIVNKSVPNEADHVLEVAEEIKSNLYKWGKLEGIPNVDKTILTYITHALTNKVDQKIMAEVAAKSGLDLGDFKFENMFKQQRKYEGTIAKINALVKKNTGKEDFFETTLSKIYMYRGLKHNQLMFEKQNYNKIVEMLGSIVDENVPLNRELYASGEDIKKMLSMLDTEKFGSMDDVIKNLKLPKEILTSYKPIVKIDSNAFTLLKKLDGEFKAFTMSDMAIREINKMGKIQFDVMNNAFLNVYDKFLQFWKTQATALNLGFHFRNATSNVFQNYLNVGSEATNPKNFYRAGKLLGEDAEYLEKTFITTKDGKKISLAKIKEQMVKLDVVGNTRFSNELDTIDTSKRNFSDQVTKAANAVGARTLNKGTKKIDPNLFNPLSQIIDIKHPLATFTKSAEDMTHQKGLLTQVGKSLGNKVENHARALNFLANIKMGKDFRESAEMTEKFLFDYSDLTDIEAKVFKRIIPFYTFMRKNMPLQFEMLFTNPNIYRTYNKVQHEIEDTVPKNQQLKDWEKNRFAYDWFQMPFSTKGKSGGKEPTFWNPNLPLADLGKFPLPTKDFVQSLFSSSSPMIKIPVELLSNKNVYFNSPISRGIGDTDDAPGYMQALTGGTKENPTQMSPELRYILRNFGFLENISKITDVKNTSSETAMALSKAFAGESLYSYDVDKFKSWALRDRLKQLRDIESKEKEKRNKR